MLDAEQIEKNYNLYVELIEKHLGSRSKPVMEMIDHLGERLAMAPASSRLEYHAAYHGGLVEHSLNVLKNAKKLCVAYNANIPIDSLIISCLFHDLGKAGDLSEPLYIDQESNWHRERGMMFTLNSNIQKMPNAERGLWLLQYFGVKLTMDEWIAIRINDGPYSDDNKYYSMHEPTLALIVHQADRMACQQEKSTS